MTENSHETPRPAHSVFLFGAGASFACDNLVPRPPLGRQLFGCLKHEGWFARLPDEVAATFERSGFEAGMAAAYAFDSSWIVPLQKQIAAYLLGLDLRTPTVYDTLLRAMPPKRFLWSTLNYDCLFEAAAERVFGSYNIGYFGRRRAADVLKLHGSANFVAPGVSVTGVAFKLGAGSGIHNGPALPIAPVEARARWMDEAESIGPAMSIFAEGKHEIVGHRGLEEWRSTWRNEIGRAKAIVCIGAHIHESDDHIWRAVGTAPGRIAFVGPERDATANWAERLNRRGVIHIAESFDAAAVAKVRRFVATL